MAFARNRFKKKAPVEGEVAPDKRKIKSKKQEQDGILFDSTLELYMYNLLKEHNIRFDLKIPYTLQEGFIYRHETVRPMIVTPDFILLDYPIIIDTKGFANEQSPMRYKMLKYKLHLEGKEMDIRMPSSQKKCRELIDGILNGFTVSEPLTEHAGTVRKNKLKKAGFIYSDGDWIIYTDESAPVFDSYNARYIMNLELFDFEELLIKYR